MPTTKCRCCGKHFCQCKSTCRSCEKNVCQCDSIKTESGLRNLYEAGKKAILHGKHEYDSSNHLQHISAIENDLKQWVTENPSEAGKINNAIEILREAMTKMDQKRLENLQAQKEEINQYLVKPMRVSETKAPNYRKLTDVL